MKGRKNLFIIIIFMVILSSFTFLQGDESSVKKKTFWFNFGLGTGASADSNSPWAQGSSNSESDMAGSINATAQFGKHAFSLRFVTGQALFEESFWDLGVLYGLATKPSVFHFSGGIGISLVGGTSGENFFFFSTKKVSTTLGLPLEIQLSWRPLRFLGLCAYGFANLNKHHTFGGVTLCVQLGKLR